MTPITRLAALVAVLVAAGSLLPAGAVQGDEAAGRWETLGEDGLVWVPAERPTVTALPAPDLGAYHNDTELAAALSLLATERPDVFVLVPVGTSVQGRTIWMLRVTGPGDASGRVPVYFDGATHGDEVIGSEILLRFLRDIHARYDGDAALRALLDAAVLDVVPMVNVDGVAYIPQCDYYADCRKNANGVDVNRNFPDHWGGAGSSSSPGSATYRGPSAASEPEAQAVVALLDATDYALVASVHSGTELILWPYGWTTTAPPEAALYDQLGDELTALTGVANGQVSRVLYLASGTTMDQAYGSAAGWRAITFSPEVYEGSGSAFDWWLLFNPPENDAAIDAVVARWMPALWHLIEEAPVFRPAEMMVPGSVAFGPDAHVLEVPVTAAARRPFIDSSVLFDAQDAPIVVDTTNPFLLQPITGTQVATFTLIADRGGEYTSRVTLDAGPGGARSAEVALDIAQVGLSVDVALDVMGTPHENTATAVVDVGPFESVSGDVSFHLEPSGRDLGSVSFSALPGSPAEVSVTFNGSGLSDGVHTVAAVADFTALWGGIPRGGLARAETTFVLTRPEVVVEKHFAPQTAARDPLPVLVILRNVGTMPALDVDLAESAPPGYVYWFRAGPVPLPQDPFGAPAPDGVDPQTDASIDVLWDLVDIPAGGQLGVRYRLMPLIPGESVLASQWDYAADYDGTTVTYDGLVEPLHVVV